jgi:prepilin-type N-terminal cleavage/methylation domain-containing protein
VKRVAGFSLLEALVALAIAAVCLVPLLTLQRQVIDSERRHEATMRRAEIQRNALVLLREVNPTEDPEGQVSLPPDLTLSWTSTPISDAKLATGQPTSGDGVFTVQLYRLEAQVLKGDQPIVPPFSVERVGWQLPESQPAAPAAAGPGAGRRG